MAFLLIEVMADYTYPLTVDSEQMVLDEHPAGSYFLDLFSGLSDLLDQFYIFLLLSVA